VPFAVPVAVAFLVVIPDLLLPLPGSFPPKPEITASLLTTFTTHFTTTAPPKNHKNHPFSAKTPTKNHPN
jgi:hypothetical protein